MLILTRKAEQGVVIIMPNGTEVIYRILGIEGERIKVGIIAPNNVQVLREELLQNSPERDQSSRPNSEGRRNPRGRKL